MLYYAMHFSLGYFSLDCLHLLLTLFLYATSINIQYFTLKICTMSKLCTGSLRIASVKSSIRVFFGKQRSHTVLFTTSVIFEI